MGQLRHPSSNTRGVSHGETHLSRLATDSLQILLPETQAPMGYDYARRVFPLARGNVKDIEFDPLIWSRYLPGLLNIQGSKQGIRRECQRAATVIMTLVDYRGRYCLPPTLDRDLPPRILHQ